MSRNPCISESRIHRKFTRPRLLIPNERFTATEDAKQIDLVPELPPSSGYEITVTAMEVFSRYLFDYPTSKQNPKTIAKLGSIIMTKYA